MTRQRLLPFALALSLCACTQAEAPTTDASAPAAAPDAAIAETAPTPEATAPVSENAGRIEFVVRGETKGTNSAGTPDSVQCQLYFTATNRSEVELKSLTAVMRITTTVDGSVVDDTSTLVMPFAFAAGETKEAWGPIVADNHRCEDLELAIQAPRAGMCRTRDRAPCPTYVLSGEGVASAG